MIRACFPLVVCVACSPGSVHFGAGDTGRAAPDDPFPIDPVLVSVDIEEGGPQQCSSGSKEIHFERKSSPSPQSTRRYLWAGGVLLGDLDEDGRADLITPSEPYAQLYRGGSHGHMQESDGLEGFDLSFATGGSLADFDDDGDLDVLVLRWDRPTVLLRNEGGGRFVDTSRHAGLDAVGAATTSAWADVDADGDLDLFVGRTGDIHRDAEPMGSLLYENRGDGTFVDRSAQLPPEVHAGWTRVAGFHDLDLDGLPELYLVNDIATISPNVLLWNRGGRFVPDGGRAGLDLMTSGSGLGIGDLNGDGRPDLLIPQWGRVGLMLSGDDGRWYDHAETSGVRADPFLQQVVGWGAELVDIDNDGDLDGLVAYGNVEVEVPGWENPLRQPDALYLQGDDGAFYDAASEFGVADLGTSRGFAVADIDRNGFVDIVKRDLTGPNVLYLADCTDAGWLEVSLRQPAPNVFAVGARVRVLSEDEDAEAPLLSEDGAGIGPWSRSITAGGTGFGSGGPPELHFGLGDTDRVTVEVTWPDGQRSLVPGVATRQTLVITR